MINVYLEFWFLVVCVCVLYAAATVDVLGRAKGPSLVIADFLCTFPLSFFSPLLDEEACRAHKIQGIEVARDLYNMFFFANCYWALNWYFYRSLTVDSTSCS